MREEWQKTTMLEACDLITCGVAARPKYVDEGVPFLSAKNVKEGQIIYEGYNCITEENHQELTKKNKPLVGDILYTRVGSYGEAAVIEKNIEFSIFVSLTLIKPKKELLNNFFLKYYLNSHEVKTLAKNSITSSGVGNLNVGTVRKFPVPIPPLEEQKQIVALLDKAFTAIDQAKTNIEKNIENAKELFQSKLNDIFNQNNDDWVSTTLGDVCSVLNGYAFKSKDAVEKSNTQLLRMGNLYKNILDLDRKPVFYPDSFSQNYKNYLLKKGDLIMSLTGTVDKTDYGYIVKIPEIDVALLLNQRIMKIEVLDSNVLNKDYLKNYLLSPDFLTRLYDTASGTRQANLSSRTILTLKINYPSQIDEQLEVVQQFKKLRKHIFKLEHEYKEKLNNLEDLKKSILQKAFAGELTKKEIVLN